MDSENWVERLSAHYRNGRPMGLFFDYDGTLTPIVAHPSLAALDPTVRALLERLSRCEGVRLGVISGRCLNELKSLVGLDRVYYAGSGGMQLDFDGDELVQPGMADVESLIDSVVKELTPVIDRIRGGWLERKPGMLTVHYRQVRAFEAECVRAAVQDAVQNAGHAAISLRVRDVTKCLEITSGDAWTKGNAVQNMLVRLPSNALPVYAGNAVNDDEAVAVVNARGGLSLAVGPEGPIDAQVRVACQADLVAGLVELTECIEAAATAATPVETAEWRETAPAGLRIAELGL